METQIEATWYPDKLNPHPLGSFPERTEPSSTMKLREQKNKDDAKKLLRLQKKLGGRQVRASYLRNHRDQVVGSALYAKRNIEYIGCLNDIISIQEEIQALFVEQEAA